MPTQPDVHVVFSLGDGLIKVCSEGGNIEIGDFICSSSTAGIGMKQEDDILRNCTVAKATKAVDWTIETSPFVLLPCTFHCG